MPFTNQTKSSSSWNNQTASVTSYANTGKDGDLFTLLQEEDAGSDTDEILFEDGDSILLEEVAGDSLTSWSNITKN